MGYLASAGVRATGGPSANDGLGTILLYVVAGAYWISGALFTLAAYRKDKMLRDEEERKSLV